MYSARGTFGFEPGTAYSASDTAGIVGPRGRDRECEFLFAPPQVYTAAKRGFSSTSLAQLEGPPDSVAVRQAPSDGGDPIGGAGIKAARDVQAI